MDTASRSRSKLHWQVAVFLVLVLSSGGSAQQSNELRESQARLQRIRQEREQLQRELDALRSQIRDEAREAANLARQRAASEEALRELDYQADVIHNQVENTNRELGSTQLRLRQRTDALHARLRSIYKRGKLHSVRVLLSAESFGDVLRRYKYLQLIALHDRAIVTEIARLESHLASQEQQLRLNQSRLESLRLEKSHELRQLDILAGRQARELREYREQERETTGRIAQLAKDEARVASLITELEKRRLAAANANAPSALSTRDLGNLNWPVEGDLVFRFGPERRPNGVVLRYNGIGIAAEAGTDVKTVEAGTVEVAGALEGYGQSVVVGHGAGYYTLYLRLRTLSVTVGQKVTAGQLIGTVGGEGTPEGPHLEFQVRTPGPTGAPIPVDPLDWLRSRAGAR